MIRSNFHVHSSFCHGKGDPEDYVNVAIIRGLQSIGFSSHAPLPYNSKWAMKPDKFQEYCATILGLRSKYKGKINIFLGLEVDYCDELDNAFYFDIKKAGIDYMIGSVHFLKVDKLGTFRVINDKDDYKLILDELFYGDIQKFVRTYYQSIRNMVQRFRPTIIGHLDLIKKNSKDTRHFSEILDWYRREVLDTLHVIKNNGSILEVNTKGMIDTNEFYPSKWILKEAKKLDIPVMINSDAHLIESIDSFYDLAFSVLREAGYSKQKILMDQQWKYINLE